MSLQDEYPKSRINIRYNTEVDGKPKDKELPMKFLVMGDLSNGTSKDRQEDLDIRNIRQVSGTLDSTIKDMNIKINMNLENHVNPSKNPMLKVSLPIESMKTFRPENIAKNIPELKQLLQIRELLKEFESTVDNNKAFRNTIKNVLRDKELVQELIKELPNIDTFKLEEAEIKETE
ncbi:MAG: type VI secretion system protein ImpB [Francisellaceae bacterium]|jgi:type VI secretion system protein ImpB